MSQAQLVNLRGPLKKRIKNRFRQLRRFLTLIESQCEKEKQNLPYANDEANDDYWQFQAKPFYADCCVALLASCYHTCERCLKEIYALTGAGFSKEVRKSNLEKLCGLFERLEIKIEETIDEYQTVDTLRLFINRWKHDPLEKANQDLRNRLKIPTSINLAPLVESDRIREELCNMLQISPNSFYPEIAMEWLSVTERFVLEVFKQSAFQIKPQKRKPVSIRPEDFLQ